MPAGHQQHQVGIGHIIGQPWRQRMARQMVHAIKRLARRGRQPLGAHHARQHATDQPRSRGHGETVNIRQGQRGLGQRLFDAKVQLFRMGAGGDFGDDTAERGMKLGLPHNDGGQHEGALPRQLTHQCGGGIIAAAFQSKK